MPSTFAPHAHHVLVERVVCPVERADFTNSKSGGEKDVKKCKVP